MSNQGYFASAADVPPKTEIIDCSNPDCTRKIPKTLNDPYCSDKCEKYARFGGLCAMMGKDPKKMSGFHGRD